MDPLYPDESAWDSYIPAMRQIAEWDLDSTREGTHTYGFPNIMEGSLGHLRVDLVQQQGIDPARFQGEWTWDLLEETMEAFAGTDVFGFAYYAGTPAYLFHSFRPLLYQQGGRFVQDDGTVRVDTEEAKTALRKMYEWRDQGWVPQDVVAYGEEDIIDLFLSGQIAYAHGYGDFVPRALNQFTADEQYRPVVPAMATTGRSPIQASVVAPNITGINSFASTADKLVGLMYGDLRLSYASQWFEFTFEGNGSFMSQVYQDAAETGFVQYGDILGEAINGGVAELFPQMQAIFQNLLTPFQQAITGEISVDDATSQGQQFIDSVLGQ